MSTSQFKHSIQIRYMKTPHQPRRGGFINSSETLPYYLDSCVNDIVLLREFFDTSSRVDIDGDDTL